MQVKVSVIIPVFNLENYIKYCLDSIVKQSYENLEIICIDDGSRDDTAKIIKQYSLNDNRIKYFYQDNSGVSAARNHGLKVASGKFIMFIDGDDYIHPNTVEMFTNCAEKTNADIVFSNFEIVYSYEHNLDIIPVSEAIKCDIEALYSQPCFTQPGESCCGKLIKREIATSSQFRTDIHIGEDSLYIMSLVSRLKTACYIDKKLYYYFQRNSSAYHATYSIKNFSCVIAYDEMCTLTANNQSTIIRDFCYRGVYRHICFNRMMSKHTPYQKEVQTACKKIGNKWLIPYLKDKNTKTINKLMNIIFYFCHPIYELARVVTDHTMIDFFKSRKKQ